MDLIAECTKTLADRWKALSGTAGGSHEVPDDIADAIRRSISSKTKTYRYVLPTQLLAKLVDPTLDCRSIQRGRGNGGFDARSICQEVIVPFDRMNHNVLGGSSEPYANNPLRIARIDQRQRAAQRDKPGFDDLRQVLDYAEKNPASITALFDTVLRAIDERLSETLIVYAPPNRISHVQATAVVQKFLTTQSGGARLQAVARALFETLGQRLGLFTQVRSSPVNAADASTGSVADLECLDASNHLVLAVEVKDRDLTLRHVEDKMPGARGRQLKELLFLVRGKVAEPDVDSLNTLVERQFAAGHNVYLCTFDQFLTVGLVLLGESGRQRFIAAVGPALDENRADFQDRKAWKSLLDTL